MTISNNHFQSKSIDERIEHLLTDRKLLLFRYDAHLRRQVYQKLTALQRQLLQRLSVAGIDAISKTALETLLRELKGIIREHYVDVMAFSQHELNQLLPLEVDASVRLYNEAVRFDLFNTAPELTKQAVSSAQIIAGSHLNQWWEKQRADLAFKFEGLIRQGLLDGKQSNQLITEVKDLLATSRRHSETLVRTAVMKVHDKAQEIVRDQNRDILKGEQQISTLDLRTSEICRVRDGKAWDLDKNPLGDHHLPYARPPLHPNCRSTMRLLTKSWRELGIDADEIPESTRASMDGQVKQGLTYKEWLKSKSASEQDDVLGKGKAELWRRGVITFRDMLDQSNRPLTLAQLSAKFTYIDGELKQMRSAWSDDFPDTVIDRKLGDATSHPLYEAAKKGDVESAYQLAKDLVTDEAVEKLRKIINGRNTILVPVHAEELVGRNMIPVATATVLSKKLNLPVDLSIVQATKVSRTGGDGWHRLMYSPAFDGHYPKGKLAVILDDTQTQGGTLASLKGYIEQQNGKVIAAYALTGKQYSVQLRLSKETLQQLREKYGNIEQWWTEQFGYDFSKLTEWEARFILNSRKTANAVRDTIIARQ